MNQSEIDAVAKIICRENGEGTRVKCEMPNGYKYPNWQNYRVIAEKTIQAGCQFYMETLK